MKRIGIITIQKCDNFGADLQAYALGAKLRMMGYDAENIDYLFYKHPRHLGGRNEKSIFGLSLVNWLKEVLYPVVATMRNFGCRATIKARHKRFAAWENRYLRCGREYRSVESLYADPPKYDIYMVGSDQVWNPRMGSNILPYFLDFAPNGVRCVSYAASMGVSSLTPKVYARYLKLLSRFSFVGVRELAAERIIAAMGLAAEVRTVLDPTLLLDSTEWANVSERPEGFGEDPYLLLYDLIPSRETVAFANRWARILGVRVVRIGSGVFGPGEFIWLMAHARAVVTNSFHGTVFSLIYKRPFYSVIPHGMTNVSRLENVLGLMGLLDRVIRASETSSMAPTDVLSWSKVDTRFDEAKKTSLDFLIRSIEMPSAEKSIKRPLACYALWNKDESVRAKSTSGGMFSVLARAIIGRGGVVYGAAFDLDFHRVRHRAARSVDELVPLLMSKYVYSDATGAMHDAMAELSAGKWVLFTGTPCQIAAMRVMSRDVSERLVLCDIVCHGTSKPEVFESYARELEARHGACLRRYEFRNKDKGWNFPNIVYAFDNGIVKRVLPRLDPFYHGYSINAFLRDACYSCSYASIDRPGDITIGDCWRVATSHPQYDDGRGVSLVLANTDKGVGVIQKILRSCEGGIYDIELARLRNMPLFQPAVKPSCYAAFAETFRRTGSFAQGAACYVNARNSLKRFARYWIKRLGWFYFKHHQ